MEKAFRGWRRFVSVKHRVRNLTFNPMHRDLNRGDQRLLWNALLNWRAILQSPGAGSSSAK